MTEYCNCYFLDNISAMASAQDYGTLKSDGEQWALDVISEALAVYGLQLPVCLFKMIADVFEGPSQDSWQGSIRWRRSMPKGEGSISRVARGGQSWFARGCKRNERWAGSLGREHDFTLGDELATVFWVGRVVQ